MLKGRAGIATCAPPKTEPISLSRLPKLGTSIRFQALERSVMALVRINPLFDLEREVETLNRLVGRNLGSRSRFSQTAGEFSPALELQNTDTAFILRAELPGFDAKDLAIEVTAEQVTLRGERKASTRQVNNGVLHSEFSYGSFERMVRLPVKVQNNAVQADYRHGILTLTLPKREEEVHRVVKLDLSHLNPLTESDNAEVTPTTPH